MMIISLPIKSNKMTTIEFTKQFRKNEQALLGFAFSLTKDKEEANDLFQETAFKAYKNKSQFIPKTNIKAWMMTIMRNTFINNYRRNKRRLHLNESQNEYVLTQQQEGISIGNEGERKIYIEELMKMIENLEVWLKIPFKMYLQGYKYEEIAQELDAPLGTIKSRIFIARKILRKEVNLKFQMTNANWEY
jgi:RNA polymerase sigma-70 factor (ECF subfamily)